MKSSKILLGIFFSLFIFVQHCSAIESWPAGAGSNIANYSNASGAVWHEGRQSLFVVQNSRTLVELSANGTEKDSWIVPGDLEGITLAENSRYLYIGIENPDSIVEFDLETNEGELTGNLWDLTTWMSSVDPNQGLEGLAYRDGYFLAGLQADGKIYVFNVNLAVSGEVSYVETITPYAGYTDIAGLEYNSDTGITYAAFDASDALIELDNQNEIAKHYTLPGSAQEGFALDPNCMARTADAYVTNDDTGVITKYTDYPITCLDADEDGVNYASDCNDYDASVSAIQTYWRDADSDGLGDLHTATEACALSAPEGYVKNDDDPVDIFSNGRLMYVNGANHIFFTANPKTVEFTNLNFYNDAYQEIIAVGLIGRRVHIIVARVQADNTLFAKRRILKKRYNSVQIIPLLEKNKFITRFNGHRRYTWKLKSSGSFSKSK